jgi:DNA uptake protein ComE-like DNA-binding protein
MVSRRYNHRTTNTEQRTRRGSALILAVVLTSLLALIGTIFLMAARVDSIGTSAISQNRDLNSAVEAVVAEISQQLSQDVPGVQGAEYYDYPDDRNGWLASLEPHDSAGYKWRQISDVTGYIGREWGLSAQRDADAEIVEEREKIDLDNDGDLEEQVADADGDGVADSKWIELDGMTSSKGQTIYAAVRVVDNGGMINVNTAYEFDPNAAASEIDGSSLTQINLFALSKRSLFNTIAQLDDERYNSEPQNLDNYIRDVVWRYYPPAQGTKYTPFDISDELELRNRFTLNRGDVHTRLEEVWNSAFHALNYLRTPVDSSVALSAWQDEVYYESSDINDVNTYSYRHIGTTYNMDRIINPAGEKMLCVNDPNIPIDSLYRTIKRAIGPGDPNSEDAAAQIAVDLVDWRDSDSDVSYYDVNGVRYYGFERPCVYISELAHVFYDPNLPTGPLGFYKSYAIELHKPYFEDNDPCDGEWRLFIDNSDALVPTSDVNVVIDWSGTRRFHVIYWRYDDPNSLLDIDFDANDNDPNAGYDLGDYSSPVEYVTDIAGGTTIFNERSGIYLMRSVNGGWVTVDYVRPPRSAGGGWLQSGSGPQSIQRDIARHKCIRRLWANATEAALPTLGGHNTYDSGEPEMIQAHPANSNFTNVGEITRLFRKDVYDDAVIRGATEDEVRFNLADPNMREVFKYLTRFDPANDNIDNDGDGQTDEATLTQTPEFKVAGRININTAPWYVIAQLPWVTHDIAQKIVEYRDTTAAVKGFENIGDLMQVAEMHYYETVEADDLAAFPDLTPGDGAADDFEERDVIFARISDLATVRSDVFTAYILVRIGTDGPQRRALAILDRSNVYPNPSGGVIGRVKVAALHPVPDPR